MEVIIFDTAEQVAARCAQIFAETVQTHPKCTLGLATGSTPIAMYKKLVEKHQNDGLSFKEVKSYNLDEYVGLSGDHHQSYRHFMNENLFDQVDINKENTFVPPGDAENPMQGAAEYEQDIVNNGGIDLQVLGIGGNGHIGFNEPTSSLGSRTRVKTLTQKTVDDNSRFFAEDEFQPTLSITMGIKTILDSKRVILLATGEGKADAIADAIEGPLAAICPASALQLHDKATFIIDRAAASKLKMTDYYKYVLVKQDNLVGQFGDPRV